MNLRAILLVAVSSIGCAAAAESDFPPWGVSSSSSGADSRGTWMPRLREAGVTMARMFPEWNGIEPRRGEWKWEAADAMVKSAGENGLRINGVLMGRVPWGTEGSHAFPMSDLDGWAGFVGAAVARYKDGIRYWEVWNEGNGGFNDGHHTTADYAKLAAIAYDAAKKANPAAAIALTTASFDPAYLRQAILAQREMGLPGRFDFLCVHPYEIADGVGRPDGDLPFLWMSRLLRDALREVAPEKAGADIWISEVGRNIARRRDQAVAEKEAAAALVKIYVMAVAQGIRCVEWFEAQDPVREEAGFGLLKRDGTPRASFHAFKTMTAALGPTPRSIGWLALGDGGRGRGFVFRNSSANVLVAWKAAGDADQAVKFDGDVKVLGMSGLVETLVAGRPLTLRDEPVFVAEPPASLVEQAEANCVMNYPWGGDYSQAKRVSLQPGSGAPGAGVYLTGECTMPVVTFPDGSTGILMSANQGAAFFVHPSFASIHTREFYVRLTVRRVTPGNVGMNLFYEVADSQGRTPYKNTGTWFGLGNSDGWQSWTWHVKDACFAKMWGHDFSFRPEQSQPFVIGKVEVSTEPF